MKNGFLADGGIVAKTAPNGDAIAYQEIAIIGEVKAGPGDEVLIRAMIADYKGGGFSTGASVMSTNGADSKWW
jgi:hypothetical protein